MRICNFLYRSGGHHARKKHGRQCAYCQYHDDFTSDHRPHIHNEFYLGLIYMITLVHDIHGFETFAPIMRQRGFQIFSL